MKVKPAVVMVYCINMPDRLLDPLLLLLLLLRAQQHSHLKNQDSHLEPK